jgi:fatty acid desaturase
MRALRLERLANRCGLTMAENTKPPPRSPFTGTVFHQGSPFWIVDGLAYDFSDWIARHPGGAVWFRTSQGRDISALFHTYHRDPQALRKMLARYRVDGPTAKDVLPKLGVPPFLVAPDFDAARDMPRFDFDASGTLLHAIRRKVAERVPRAALRRHDLAFDFVTGLLAVVHVAILAALVLGAVPAWAFVVTMVATRTGLAGAGHYGLHRRKDDNDRKVKMALGQSLFDLNYVGTCLIGADGHVLLHHPHLGTGADVKRTFFDGMLRLHPVLRVVGYTVHKLGICLVGLSMRGLEIGLFERDKGIFRVEFWFMRAFLLLELAACALSGHSLAWAMQFALTLWFNTFLVVASHDYEHDGVEAELAKLPPHLRGDWAARQIVLSYDLTVVGNRWIDLFLSAGLGPHRVHHVLPSQKSGFANLASEAAVREACLDAGIAWERPRNLVTERFPALLGHYLLSAPKRAGDRGGGGAWRELGELARYAVEGWRGVGV